MLILPIVGADYCILRVNDEKEGERWIEAIRSAVPDYDKVRMLAAAPPADDDTDSDDEEDDEDMPVDTMYVSLFNYVSSFA